MECPKCNGTGTITRPVVDRDDYAVGRPEKKEAEEHFTAIYRDPDRVREPGERPERREPEEPCARCGGTGVIHTTEMDIFTKEKD
jgi:hypothetical protein